MTALTLQDIKAKGAKAIPDDEPSLVIVNSKIKSVMVPIDTYNMFIEAMEELEDIMAIREYEKCKDDETIDFDDWVRANAEEV